MKAFSHSLSWTPSHQLSSSCRCWGSLLGDPYPHWTESSAERREGAEGWGVEGRGVDWIEKRTSKGVWERAKGEKCIGAQRCGGEESRKGRSEEKGSEGREEGRGRQWGERDCINHVRLISCGDECERISVWIHRPSHCRNERKKDNAFIFL